MSKRPLEHREVLGEALPLGPEREPGARRSPAPARAVLTRIGSPLQERAPPEARRVDVAEHRCLHDADDRLAVGHQCDRHADDREAVHEVGGAVERVDEPADLGALAAGLLAEERELGGGVVQHRLHRGLARGVGVADPVARPLLADVRAPRRTRRARPRHRPRRRVGRRRGGGRGRGPTPRSRRHRVAAARRAARGCRPPPVAGGRRRRRPRGRRPRRRRRAAPASRHTSRPPR